MPGKLSELLEKIEAKYPDDEDVIALTVELGEGSMNEDAEFEEDDMFAEEGMGDEEAGPMAFDDLFSEDMEEDMPEDEMDFEMPPKKGKKKSPKNY